MISCVLYVRNLIKSRVGGIKIVISANETRLVPVEVRAFIADSPARAYLTSTKGHMGSYGCHRCNALQKKYNYPPTKGDERTDSTFNDRLHVDHHSDDYRVKKSLLEEYKYKMVTKFPIDGMHALDQGLGKLIVKAVVQKKIKKGSMDHKKVPSACERHGTYKDCAPSLFSRKPRPLSDFGKFKATEFRQFLLYTGLVLVKELLSSSGYYHFLCLSLGYRIISSSNITESRLSVADRLFNIYMRDFHKHYEVNLSYNVHCLLHMVVCVRLYGPIDSFSAYTYENSIRKLQFLVKNNTNVLGQIRNRMEERRKAQYHKTTNDLKRGNLIGGCNSYHRIDYTTFVHIIRMSKCKTKCTIRAYTRTAEHFDKPKSSKEFGIVLVDDNDLGEEQEIDVNNLVQQCYRIPFQNKFVLIPLCH